MAKMGYMNKAAYATALTDLTDAGFPNCAAGQTRLFGGPSGLFLVGEVPSVEAGNVHKDMLAAFAGSAVPVTPVACSDVSDLRTLLFQPGPHTESSVRESLGNAASQLEQVAQNPLQAKRKPLIDPKFVLGLVRSVALIAVVVLIVALATA